MNHDDATRSILLFLPDKPARALSGRLDGRGYRVQSAQTLSDLRHKLEDPSFGVVVTTRRSIDAVRSIRPLPVVNLEIFFGPPSLEEPSDSSPGRFDWQGLERRLEFLSRQGALAG